MTSAIDISEQCLCYKMRSASRTITRIYDEHFKQAGIKANQFTMLVAISVMQPASITALAEQLNMERTTLTRNLSPLEKDTLVVIKSGKGRTRYVSLTPSGTQLIEAVKPLWSQAQEKIKHALGQSEVSALSKISKDINQLAEINL